jgi:hypothetical protein
MFSKSLGDLYKNPVVAVPNIIFAIIPTVFIGLAYDFLNGQSYNMLLFKFLLYCFLGIILLVLIQSLILSWSYILCRDSVNGVRPSLGGSFNESLRYYPRVLGASLLIGLLLIGTIIAFAMIAVPFGLLIGFSDSSVASSGAIIMTIIVFLLVILATIFLSISISPIIPLLVYEDLSVGKSFFEGFKLGLKKFFPILGVALFMSIVILPLYLVFVLLSGSYENLHPIYQFIYTSLSSFPQMLIVIYIMNLYRDKLKLEKQILPDYHDGLEVSEATNENSHSDLNDNIV